MSDQARAGTLSWGSAIKLLANVAIVGPLFAVLADYTMSGFQSGAIDRASEA